MLHVVLKAGHFIHQIGSGDNLTLWPTARSASGSHLYLKYYLLTVRASVKGALHKFVQYINLM